MEPAANGERPTKIRKLDSKTDQSEASDTVMSMAEAKSDEKLTTNSKADSPSEESTGQQPGALPTEISEQAPDVAAEAHPSAPPLSKNALKKLRKREEWEAGREDRKVLRKEKNKARKERKRAEYQAAAEENTANGKAVDGEGEGVNGSGKKAKWQRAVQLPITIVMDCSWDELMVEKEMISLGSQLTRSYSDNAKARFRAHLTVSSFGGRLKERFETTLAQQYLGWKGVRFLEGDFVEAAREAKTWMSPEAKGGRLKGQFSKYEGQEEKLQQEAEVIYLSSDSDETLTELKPYSTYILGGLVDKNRYKGICQKKAMEKGIKTAKLPIGDYMSMASRFVLTVNHVNEIMLRWLECGDWGQAFDAVIPKRKGGVLKAAEAVEDEDAAEVATNIPEEPAAECEAAAPTEASIQTKVESDDKIR